MWPKSPSRCKYEFHLTEARHAPPADPPPPPPPRQPLPNCVSFLLQVSLACSRPLLGRLPSQQCLRGSRSARVLLCASLCV